MLDRIRNSPWFRVANATLLLAALCTLSSCATNNTPQPLVSNSATDQDSAIPWNEQQKWETQGQLGQMAEHMDRR